MRKESLLLILYKKETGDANCLARYKTKDGYGLGAWQTSQRLGYNKDKLSKERVKKLEEIGFVWKINEHEWNIGYQVALKYKNETGNLNCSSSYVTKEGFALSHWLRTQRKRYKSTTIKKKRGDGILSAEQIKKLEDIGFDWDPINSQREFWYNLTLEYKNNNGIANCPKRHITEDGHNLGQFQQHLRIGVTRGRKYPSEFLDKMEKLGFDFSVVRLEDRIDKQWNKAYEKTLKYKEETGDANCLTKYIMNDGYGLGQWQLEQRFKYKNRNLDEKTRLKKRIGKLSNEQIKKLEDIGFLWTLPRTGRRKFPKHYSPSN